MQKLHFDCEKCSNTLEISIEEFEEEFRDENKIFGREIECPICNQLTRTVVNISEDKKHRNYLYTTIIACAIFAIIGAVIGKSTGQVKYREITKTNYIEDPDAPRKKLVVETARRYNEAIENATQLRIGELHSGIKKIAVFVNLDPISNALLSRRNIIDSLSRHLNNIGIEVTDDSDYSLNCNIQVLEMRKPQLDLYIYSTEISILRRVLYFDKQTNGDLNWYRQPAQIWSSGFVSYVLPVEFNEKMVIENVSARMRFFENEIIESLEKSRRSDK